MSQQNDLSSLLIRLDASIQDVLKKQGGLFDVANTDFSDVAVSPGDTIRIPFPVSTEQYDVTPGITGSQAAGVTPSNVSVTFDHWKGRRFGLTGQQMLEINTSDFVIRQTEQAVEDLSGDLERVYFDAAFSESYQQIKTLAQASSSNAPFTSLRRTLFNNQAPASNRWLVANSDLDDLYNNQDLMPRLVEIGSIDTRRTGDVGQLSTFNIRESQHVPSYTFDGGAGDEVGTGAEGSKTLTVSSAASASQVLQAGNIFTITGHTGNYVVTAGAALSSNSGSVSIEPALRAAAGAAALTFEAATYDGGLAMHRDGLLIAMRPGAIQAANSGVVLETTDPVSGAPFAIVVDRQNDQVVWRVQAMAAAKVLRPEFIIRASGTSYT